MINYEKRVLLDYNFGWKFIKSDMSGANEYGYDDSCWQEVQIPHDWSIEGPFSKDNPSTSRGGYLPGGIGWYRKAFSIPEEYKNKKVTVEFDGIHMNSDVWINGVHLGHYPYGYTSFEYDLSEHLNYGGKTNIISVRVDNSMQPASRWYTGAGIYRDVRLVVTEKLHIKKWGVFVTTPDITQDKAAVNISTVLQDEGRKPQNEALELVQKVINQEGNIVIELKAPVTMSSDGPLSVFHSAEILNPNLWSPEKPYIYTLKTQILCGNDIVDDYITTFGIRDVKFDPNLGMLLNGKQTKLKGVCLHHDNGCLGSAAYQRADERRLEILKDMGCNAIRTSHNPMAPYFLDLCDRMGFLVMEEAFDEWHVGKCPIVTKDGVDGRILMYGYSRYFDQWHETDLRAMVKRDRNHPSIIMWSIGNEIREQIDKIFDGNDISRRLNEIVKDEDPTRPVTCACSQTESANATGFSDTLDILGYNYREHLYYEDHEKNPDRLMVGSETTSHTPFWRRGDYFLDELKKVNKSKPDKFTNRILSAEESMQMNMGLDYIQGLFIWTGFDYFGETTPYTWPSRSSYFGVIDTCGFPKDSFYYYKACWQDEPVLQILPHWNWKGKEGEKIPVLAYTNCDSVELFLNGKFVGKKNFKYTKEMHLYWEVEYEAGTLEAHGYKGSEKVCVKKIQTSGAPAAIRLEADRLEIKADSKDLSYITAKVVDKNGIIVPDACVPVSFTFTGEGCSMGVDNGDPTYVGDLKANTIPALNGLCLTVVKSGLKPGEITVKAAASGLTSNEIKIKAT